MVYENHFKSAVFFASVCKLLFFLIYIYLASIFMVLVSVFSMYYCVQVSLNARNKRQTAYPISSEDNGYILPRSDDRIDTNFVLGRKPSQCKVGV